MMIEDGRTARTMVIGLVLLLSFASLAGTGSADPSDFVISSTPDTTAVVGEVYHYRVGTADRVRSLSILQGPEGMMLSDEVLTWTPEAEGVYRIVLMAVDLLDNVATQSFALRVLPSDRSVPSLVILHPLTGSKFRAGEDIEVRGVLGSGYDILELTPELDGRELRPVQVRGRGDWVLTLDEGLRPGTHSLTVRVGRPDGASMNETSIEFEVVARPLNIEAAYVAFTPIYLAILSFSMVAMCDAAVFHLSGLFIAPLYSRIKKEAVLDRYIRGRIFEFVRNNPGATYNNIKRGVGLSNGCLTYHLKVLNNTEMIHSKRNGTFRHFYPKEMPIPKVVFRLSPPQKSILEILDETPGICQVNLAREAGMTNTALNYHIKLLRKAGIISIERAGKRTRCYLVKEEVPVTE
jgi:predicted transcriptional regulator